MRAENQRFGNNLRVYMYEDTTVSEKDFLQRFGYTEYELQKIYGARTYISIEEEKKIADYLKKPLEAFFEVLSDARYMAAGCYECRGEFDDPQNRQLIFNIFDLHCDVQEALKGTD